MAIFNSFLYVYQGVYLSIQTSDPFSSICYLSRSMLVGKRKNQPISPFRHLLEKEPEIFTSPTCSNQSSHPHPHHHHHHYQHKITQIDQTTYIELFNTYQISYINYHHHYHYQHISHVHLLKISLAKISGTSRLLRPESWTCWGFMDGIVTDIDTDIWLYMIWYDMDMIWYDLIWYDMDIWLPYMDL